LVWMSSITLDEKMPLFCSTRGVEEDSDMAV